MQLKKNKKIILWIDIGTHRGQEIMAALGPQWLILARFVRRFLSAHIFRRGVPYSWKSLSSIRKKRLEIARRAQFKTIVVEPNIELFSQPIYKFADHAFGLALGRSAQAELTKLYFIEGARKGQGSSIFESKKNTSPDDYSLSPLLDPAHFFSSLKSLLPGDFGGSEYDVILRINCEGSESEIIRDCHAVYGQQLKLVMGSLKDVGEIKGAHELASLKSFLDLNQIRFVPFSSLWESWPDALDAIVTSLRK